jgi:hypothetical protein
MDMVSPLGYGSLVVTPEARLRIETRAAVISWMITQVSRDRARSNVERIVVPRIPRWEVTDRHLAVDDATLYGGIALVIVIIVIVAVRTRAERIAVGEMLLEKILVDPGIVTEVADQDEIVIVVIVVAIVIVVVVVTLRTSTFRRALLLVALPLILRDLDRLTAIADRVLIPRRAGIGTARQLLAGVCLITGVIATRIRDPIVDITLLRAAHDHGYSHQ